MALPYALSRAYRRSVRHMRAAGARYTAARLAADQPYAPTESWEAAQQELDAAERSYRAAQHAVGNPGMAWMFQDEQQ